MEKLFHTRWWDYSKQFMNLHGRVCLKNSFLFGCMSLAVMYFIHPFVSHFVLTIPYSLRSIIAISFIIFFTFDVYHTVDLLLHRNKTYLEVESAIEELKLCLESVDFVPGETLKDRIEYVLDTTDADERLLCIIDKIKQKLEVDDKHKKMFLHLSKAFPSQHLSSSREKLESIIEIFLRYKGK